MPAPGAFKETVSCSETKQHGNPMKDSSTEALGSSPHTLTPCILQEKEFTFQTVEIINSLKHSLFYLTSAASLCQCILKYHSKWSMKLLFSKLSSCSFHLPRRTWAGNGCEVKFYSRHGWRQLPFCYSDNVAFPPSFLFYKRLQTTVWSI